MRKRSNTSPTTPPYNQGRASLLHVLLERSTPAQLAVLYLGEARCSGPSLAGADSVPLEQFIINRSNVNGWSC